MLGLYPWPKVSYTKEIMTNLKSYSEQFIFPIEPYNNIQNMFWLFMVATPIKVALLETESHNETHDLGK